MSYLTMLPSTTHSSEGKPLSHPKVAIRAELEQIVLTITEATHAQVNKLRRALIRNVQGIAFDQVLIETNSTGVINEDIAFRINMIPIEAKTNSLKLIEDGQPMNGSNVYKFTIDTLCRGAEMCHVYSGDLNWEPLDSQDPDNEPTILYDDLQIVSLAPGQELKLTAYAIRGHSSSNMKFSPIRDVYYGDDGKLPPTFTFYIGLLHNISLEEMKEQLLGLPDIPPLEFIDEGYLAASSY